MHGRWNAFVAAQVVYFATAQQLYDVYFNSIFPSINNGKETKILGISIYYSCDNSTNTMGSTRNFVNTFSFVKIS
jgi:hypothetical protein